MKDYRVNLNINYGLWMTMMCYCRFISRDECPTLVGDVDHGGGHACVGAGSLWEISVPSFFGCELSAALKNEVFRKHT